MYAIITNWEFASITDEMLQTIENVFFPRLKAQGALDVYNIQTSETTGSVVSVWPDKDTADKAMDEVQSVRSEATSTFDSKVISVASGPVIVKAQSSLQAIRLANLQISYRAPRPPTRYIRELDATTAA